MRSVPFTLLQFKFKQLYRPIVIPGRGPLTPCGFYSAAEFAYWVIRPFCWL